MFRLDALSSAANRVNPTTVPMPIYYDKDRKTEDEAKLVWNIEESLEALTELEIVNLTSHLENRAMFGAREQRWWTMEWERLGAIAVTPAGVIGELVGYSLQTVGGATEGPE